MIQSNDCTDLVMPHTMTVSSIASVFVVDSCMIVDASGSGWVFMLQLKN